MADRVRADFEVTSWDESPFDEGTGVAKLTEARVSKTYTGGVEGTSSTRWLMAYAPDSSAAFVGLERVQGVVAGRQGSLVVQHVGTFENGSADATLTVLSGTGGLEAVSGTGEFTANPAGSITLELSFG